MIAARARPVKRRLAPMDQAPQLRELSREADQLRRPADIRSRVRATAYCGPFGGSPVSTLALGRSPGAATVPAADGYARVFPSL